MFTIKKIIKKEFGKHEKKIGEMIKLHLSKTSNHVTEVTRSVKFTKYTLDEELGTGKNVIKKLAFEMKELDNNLLDPNKVLQKFTKLKDRPY